MKKQTPHISKQSVLQLNHILLVLLSLHPFKLNLMFVLLRQLLHRFIQFSLLIALSARLRLSSTSLTHIVEACKHDKNQHDPQEDIVVKQPGNVLQILDLHAEDSCASRIPQHAFMHKDINHFGLRSIVSERLRAELQKRQDRHEDQSTRSRERRKRTLR